VGEGGSLWGVAFCAAYTENGVKRRCRTDGSGAGEWGANRTAGSGTSRGKGKEWGGEIITVGNRGKKTHHQTGFAKRGRKKRSEEEEGGGVTVRSREHPCGIWGCLAVGQKLRLGGRWCERNGTFPHLAGVCDCKKKFGM